MSGRTMHRFLYRHSRLYRRWMWWRVIRSMRRMERTLGLRLVPALDHATQGMRHWLDTLPADFDEGESASPGSCSGVSG